jgi:hypothetical protein
MATPVRIIPGAIRSAYIGYGYASWGGFIDYIDTDMANIPAQCSAQVQLLLAAAGGEIGADVVIDGVGQVCAFYSCNHHGVPDGFCIYLDPKWEEPA